MKIQTAAGKTFAIIINSLYIAYARKLIDVATKIKSTVVLIELSAFGLKLKLCL
jgi:hypothetical protein